MIYLTFTLSYPSFFEYKKQIKIRKQLFLRLKLFYIVDKIEKYKWKEKDVYNKRQEGFWWIKNYI